MFKRRYFGVSLVIFLVTSYAIYYFLTKKEAICHIDSTTGERTTIYVRWFEKSEHLDHGDFTGTCDEARTYVPDDRFENALIYWGYDDVMDDYVLTRNIDTVERLSFTEFEEANEPPVEPFHLYDFTGIEDFTSLKRFKLQHLFSVPSIDLSNNSALTHITIDNCHVENLIFPRTSSLQRIFVRRSFLLNNLDLSTSLVLESIRVNGNSAMTSIDFSNCPLLSSMDISGASGLTKVNLQNGRNTTLTNDDVFIHSNDLLTCIQVDDVAWSTANWTRFDPTIFSLDCGF